MKFDDVTDWRDLVLALPERVFADQLGEDAAGRRVALFAIWLALYRAPNLIEAKFQGIDEARLALEANASVDRIERADLGLTDDVLNAEATDVDIVARLVAVCRHLEDLVDWDQDDHAPTDPTGRWAETWDGIDGFIVPLGRKVWKSAPPAQEDKRPLSQRLLRKVRIFPKLVGGYEVVLYRPDSLGVVERPLRFGAGLFESVDFDDDKVGAAPDSSARVIRNLKAPGFKDTIERVCRGSFMEGCLATVFPELCIDPSGLQHIRDQLSEKPWSPGSGRPPAVVVAGSWHEQEQGGWRNRSRLLDGHGEPVHCRRDGTIREVHYDKRRKFDAKLHGERWNEGIDLGTEVPILVLDEGLISLGICPDLCDQGVPTEYEHLPVDFVLVPSLGNWNTLTYHVDAVRNLLNRNKTRCFVVQQSFPASEAGYGFVVPPDAQFPAPYPTSEPTDSSQTAAPFITGQPWSVYDAAKWQGIGGT